MSIHDTWKAGRATPEEALDLFDALEPVEVAFMIGAWKGEGFHTGHRMDGLLESYRWHGKRFECAEAVHPLVFSTLGGGVACVNPAFMGSAMVLIERFPALKAAAVARLFRCLLPLLSTTRPRARLRMTAYRGKSSATMIYDQLPIHDVFRRFDDNAVLGVMDRRGMEQPFFFRLRREPESKDARPPR